MHFGHFVESTAPRSASFFAVARYTENPFVICGSTAQACACTVLPGRIDNCNFLSFQFALGNVFACMNPPVDNIFCSSSRRPRLKGRNKPEIQRYGFWLALHTLRGGRRMFSHCINAFTAFSPRPVYSFMIILGRELTSTLLGLLCKHRPHSSTPLSSRVGRFPPTSWKPTGIWITCKARYRCSGSCGAAAMSCM